MGVEYRHFLVPANPKWLPQVDTLLRVDAVLRKWSLVAREPIVFKLKDGRKRNIPTIPVNSFGLDLAVEYSMIEGRAVRAIFGPSFYPNIQDGERYIQKISVLVGLDYRIHSSSEAFYFKVTETPDNDGIPVKPYSHDDGLYLCGEVFRATALTRPPNIEIHVDEKCTGNVAWKGYKGYWRAALILDCGKDLPGFIEGLQALPSQGFIEDVSAAFGTKVYEIGEVY
jgi:hypothetical protein